MISKSRDALRISAAPPPRSLIVTDNTLSVGALYSSRPGLKDNAKTNGSHDLYGKSLALLPSAFRDHHRARHGHAVRARQYAHSRTPGWPFRDGGDYDRRGGACADRGPWRRRPPEMGAVAVFHPAVRRGRLYGLDRRHAATQFDRRRRDRRRRLPVALDGVSPGRNDLPAQSESLSLHARGVPAVHAAAIRRPLDPGADHGRDDRADAAWRLWPTGRRRPREPR